MNKIIRISGTGCALADFLYTGVDFNGPDFKKYLSRKPGDGGLSPGKLVFTEELESFAGKPYPAILDEITGSRLPDTFNIGGPSLVSLIHVAQILNDPGFRVDFYGISGNDETSQKIRQLLAKTPVNFSSYLPESRMSTPFTHVLSDPSFDNGHGERTFINNIGAAWDLKSESLPSSFFDADMVCLGGTALTPNIHDNLHLLLRKAKNNGALTVVNTVYDFRNEKQQPLLSWPLGNTYESLDLTDILIMDNEEALKISGQNNITQAAEFFRQYSNAFVITRGSQPVYYYSSGKLFKPASGELPVSQKVTNRIKEGLTENGDTTGCGDNFTGGIIAATALQMAAGIKPLNLEDAIVHGICAGGFTCFYKGGTYLEQSAGEKKKYIEDLVKDYQLQQIQ